MGKRPNPNGQNDGPESPDKHMAVTIESNSDSDLPGRHRPRSGVSLAPKSRGSLLSYVA